MIVNARRFEREKTYYHALSNNKSDTKMSAVVNATKR